MENLLDASVEPKNLELESAAIQHLSETRKWTNFLSIMGFVFIGILILVVVFGSSILSQFSGGVANPLVSILPLVLIVVLYFFPIYYLFMFSKFSKQAISDNDPEAFTTSMKYLKFHYRFMGILVIVIFGIYAIIGISAGVGYLFTR